MCDRHMNTVHPSLAGWCDGPPCMYISVSAHDGSFLDSFIGAASEYWSGVHGCAALAVAVAHQGGVWVQLPSYFGPGTGHLLG